MNWDLWDEFEDVSARLFSSLVLGELGVSDAEISPGYAASPVELPGFIVVPSSLSGVRIHINREIPRSGYWDYPVSIVCPSDVELHFMRFFDFDVLGCRDFEYLEVYIHASPKYPEIVGRVALLNAKCAQVFYRGS